MQQAKLMHRIILASVACPAVQYFPILSRNLHDFRKTVIEHNIFFLIFPETFIWNTSYSMKKSARYYDKSFNVKYPLFLSDFNETWILWTDF